MVLVSALLKGERHDRNSAAALLRVKPAAAARQLHVLSKLPGAAWEQRGRLRVLRLDKEALREPPSLAEVISACFGASLGRLFSGTTYEPGMRRALDFVLEQSRHYARFRAIDRKFLFIRQGGESSFPEAQPQLDELLDALLNHYRVRLKYRSSRGDVRDIRVEPLSLAIYEHQLYLIGKELNGELHIYRFSRIAKVIPEKQAVFVYPDKAGYDPDQVFKNSFGIFLNKEYELATVEVRVSGYLTTFVETHRYHPSQQRIVNPDGSVQLILQVQICPEVERWILGLGDDVEVLGPPSLRAKIAARLKRAHRRYERATPKRERVRRVGVRRTRKR